jgi:hypothetical protein
MKHSMNSADLQSAGFLIQSRDSIESVVRQPRGRRTPNGTLCAKFQVPRCTPIDFLAVSSTVDSFRNAFGKKN